MLTARQSGTGPLVLLGDGRSATTRALFERYGWGRMVVERSAAPLAGERWALDNGAYRDYKAGRPVCFRRFVRRLDRIAARLRAGTLSVPEFVVVPDLIGVGERGLAYSVGWVERLRRTYGHLPLRWYLVLQGGFERGGVEEQAARFDGFFLGGSDGFKEEEGEEWRALARRLGIGFHYGRCSTPAHLERAWLWAVDSLDTARPLTRAEYLSEFIQTWEKLAEQSGTGGVR